MRLTPPVLILCVAGLASAFVAKDCRSTICQQNTVFDMLQLQPGLSNLTEAVLSSPDVKRALQNPGIHGFLNYVLVIVSTLNCMLTYFTDDKLTIFAPVDNSEFEPEFKSLIARASKLDASDEDKQSLADHLKG